LDKGRIVGIITADGESHEIASNYKHASDRLYYEVSVFAAKYSFWDINMD
jgi:hypothetical protein